MNNIKKILFIFSLYIALTSQAQSVSHKSLSDKSALKWTSNLSWEQILKKAKKENKYIFVDCFATWCKPCKEMDQNVYSVDSVGNYLNADFISVKLQMDQTKNDDAATRIWYETARSFAKNYNLNAYPTMLFFTPSGDIATKEVGYKDAGSFIETAKNSKDPSKQYFVLLKKFKKGKLDDAAKRSLILTAKQLNDTINYRPLRDSYLAQLHTLPKKKLYTRENIEFIASIINTRNQSVFDMFYPDGSAVDKVMEQNGYARKVVGQVVMKEKVTPFLNAAINAKTEPDWSSIYNLIGKHYRGDYAAHVLFDAKLIWYNGHGNSMQFARAMNDQMEKYGADTTDRGVDFKLNTSASIIWGNIGMTKKLDEETLRELSRVTVWMEGVVRRGATGTGIRLEQWPSYIDTYANLLYKTGREEEAIKWQKLAILKSKEIGGESKYSLEEMENNLSLMKKGEPTWPVKEK